MSDTPDWITQGDERKRHRKPQELTIWEIGTKEKEERQEDNERHQGEPRAGERSIPLPRKRGAARRYTRTGSSGE